MIMLGFVDFGIIIYLLSLFSIHFLQMFKQPSIVIDQTLVGNGYPVYFIAEIGSNHNQDYDLACRSIEAAAKAGVIW